MVLKQLTFKQLHQALTNSAPPPLHPSRKSRNKLQALTGQRLFSI